MMYLARLDVMLVSKKLAKFQAASKSPVKMTFWLDWWMVTVSDVVNSTQPVDIAKVHHLFTAGGNRLRASPRPALCLGELCLQEEGCHFDVVHQGDLFRRLQQVEDQRSLMVEPQKCKQNCSAVIKGNLPAL